VYAFMYACIRKQVHGAAYFMAPGFDVIHACMHACMHMHA
jgi:hypothetical protein